MNSWMFNIIWKWFLILDDMEAASSCTNLNYSNLKKRFVLFFNVFSQYSEYILRNNELYIW
jgi:hypothetical protein